MTAIREVLAGISAGRIVASSAIVDGLEVALDLALDAYAMAAGKEGRRM